MKDRIADVVAGCARINSILGSFLSQRLQKNQTKQYFLDMSELQLYELTAPVFVCARSAGDKSSQHFSTMGGVTQAPTPEELLMGANF